MIEITKVWTIYTDDTKHLKSCIYFLPIHFIHIHYSNLTLCILTISSSSETNDKIYWFGVCSMHFPRANRTVTCIAPHWKSFPSLHSISVQPAGGLPLSILSLVIFLKASKREREFYQTLTPNNFSTIKFSFLTSDKTESPTCSKMLFPR